TRGPADIDRPERDYIAERLLGKQFRVGSVPRPINDLIVGGDVSLIEVEPDDFLARSDGDRHRPAEGTDHQHRLGRVISRNLDMRVSAPVERHGRLRVLQRVGGSCGEDQRGGYRVFHQSSLELYEITISPASLS